MQTRDRSRLFPRPAYLLDTPTYDLVFEKCTSRPRAHPLFHAKYDERPVVVKYSYRYHEEAHCALAQKGLALHVGCHSWLRGLHMIITDYVDGTNALHQFRDKSIPQGVVKQIANALDGTEAPAGVDAYQLERVCCRFRLHG